MLYRLIIFLSAFLLFQVQPFIAKLLLPLFGGGAAIWTACLLFFQGFLLLGYLYSHYLCQLRKMNNQIIIHCALLLVSLLYLPISLNNGDLTASHQTPLMDIIAILVSAIGLPYLMLSSTGPLLQRWFTLEYASTSPYKLYSLSNIASLMALLCYPLIIEPTLTLRTQSIIWSVTYLCLMLVFIQLFRKIYPKEITQVLAENNRTTSENSPTSHPNINSVLTSHYWLWLFLSAVGVILLVSTTNAMTQNVPPVPFLWILPLALYLLSFIISFHHQKWYQRWYWLALFSLAAFAGILMIFIGSQFDFISQVLMYSLLLFSACMVCHGELARIKPQANKLTLFYLLISLGGFLGSVFVSVIATQLFDHFYEFPLAIIAVFGLFIYIVKHDESNDNHLPLVNKSITIISLSTVAIGLVLLFGQLSKVFNQNDVVNMRNFYGLLSVKDLYVNGKYERRLIDGTTSHGTQSLEMNDQKTAKSYYRKNTGVALALTYHSPIKPIKAGIIGLGSGTLATYGRLGDYYQFYEINPNVAHVANEYFTYLGDSPANINIDLGDGRLLLQKRATKNTLNSQSSDYDVLVLDAFSGDAIPAHLLTVEAFELYWQHLDINGVLAVHISNSHLDLKPLMRGIAATLNKSAYYFKTDASEDEPNMAEWVLITNNDDFISHYQVKNYISTWPNNDEKLILWTDNYSNLLSVLK